MTVGEKLTAMRAELRQLVRNHLDADEDEAALKVLSAISVLNDVRNHLSDTGLDDDLWLSDSAETDNE